MNKLLIVDDEDRYLTRIPSLLRDFGLQDVQIDTAATVDEALSKLRANEYGLVSFDGMGQKGEWRRIYEVAREEKVDCILTASMDWSEGEVAFFKKSGFGSLEGRGNFKNIVEAKLAARSADKERL